MYPMPNDGCGQVTGRLGPRERQRGGDRSECGLGGEDHEDVTDADPVTVAQWPGHGKPEAAQERPVRGTGVTQPHLAFARPDDRMLPAYQKRVQADLAAAPDQALRRGINPVIAR